MYLGASSYIMERMKKQNESVSWEHALTAFSYAHGKLTLYDQVLDAEGDCPERNRFDSAFETTRGPARYLHQQPLCSFSEHRV